MDWEIEAGGRSAKDDFDAVRISADSSRECSRVEREAIQIESFLFDQTN